MDVEGLQKGFAVRRGIEGEACKRVVTSEQKLSADAGQCRTGHPERCEIVVTY